MGVGEKGHAKPVLCVELVEDAWRDQESVRRELLKTAQAHEQTRGIKTILFHPSFPVDVRHNSKIFREKLAEWAEKKVAK